MHPKNRRRDADASAKKYGRAQLCKHDLTSAKDHRNDENFDV